MTRFPNLGKAGFALALALLVGAVIVLVVVYRNIQFDRGTSAIKSQNYDKAMKALKPLAQLGDSMSQYLLGQMFAFGWGVPQDDGQAMYWFRRARMWYSGRGDKGAEAAFYVGKENAEQNKDSEATKWYRVAAEGGSRQAAIALSKAYEEGSHGLRRDPEQARSWKEKADNALPSRTH